MTINEGPCESQFAMETKELFLKLIKQADERYCEKNSRMQMILEQQTSVISELRLELAALRVQMGSMNAAIEIQLVKATQQNVKLAPQSCAAPQSEATTKRIGQIQQDASIEIERSELYSGQSSKPEVIDASNDTKMRSTSPDKPRLSSTTNQPQCDLISAMPGSTSLEKSQPQHDLISAMPGSISVEEYETSKKNLKNLLPRNHTHISMTRKKHDEISTRTVNASDKLHSSNVKHAGAAAVPSVSVAHLQWTKFAPTGATSGTRPEQFAFTANTVQGTPTSNPSSEEQDTSRRYKQDRNRFHVASAPKDERMAAHERIEKALDKVSYKVSMERTGDRTSCDLYVGNLDFNADCDDLSESIRLHFKRIQVDNISIPQGNDGRNRGY
jgi:hypothetical protein